MVTQGRISCFGKSNCTLERSTAVQRSLKCAALASLCVVSACANFNSIYRNRDTGGKTASVDAYQRFLISSRRHRDGQSVDPITVYCAEPSPDAMTALSYSLSGKIQNESSAKALTAAFGQNSSSIGLRTQSIQLMRDAMYRLCEGYAAGAIDKEQFFKMQGRYQDLVLGLLAIEQLTGAVVAQQSVLTTASSGGAGGDATDEADQLKKARETQATEKAALQKATETFAADTADFNTKKKTLEEATAKRKGHEDDETLKTAETDARTAADAAETKKKQSELEKLAAEDRVANSNGAVSSAQQALLAAQLQLKSGTSGHGQFGAPIVMSKPLSDASVDKVGLYVSKIVDTVLTKGFRADECIDVLGRLAISTPGSNTDAQKQFASYCVEQEKVKAADAEHNLLNFRVMHEQQLKNQ